MTATLASSWMRWQPFLNFETLLSVGVLSGDADAIGDCEGYGV